MTLSINATDPIRTLMEIFSLIRTRPCKIHVNHLHARNVVSSYRSTSNAIDGPRGTVIHFELFYNIPAVLSSLIKFSRLFINTLKAETAYSLFQMAYYTLTSNFAREYNMCGVA